jgi:hypothetical protein
MSMSDNTILTLATLVESLHKTLLEWDDRPTLAGGVQIPRRKIACVLALIEEMHFGNKLKPARRREIIQDGFIVSAETLYAKRKEHNVHSAV